MRVKYGLNIPYNTFIGPGLLISHFGGIVVNAGVKIGNNCNLNHGVTLGIAYGVNNPGCPVVGNGVFLGAGCKLFGGIHIGDDVAIGANCVVTKDVETGATIVGGKPRVFHGRGTAREYVINRWKK